MTMVRILLNLRIANRFYASLAKILVSLNLIKNGQIRPDHRLALNRWIFPNVRQNRSAWPRAAGPENLRRHAN